MCGICKQSNAEKKTMQTCLCIENRIWVRSLQCRRPSCVRQECYHGAFGTGPPNYRRVSLVRPEALCNYYDCNALDISLSWPTVPFEEWGPEKTLCVNYIKCVPCIVKATPSNFSSAAALQVGSRIVHYCCRKYFSLPQLTVCCCLSTTGFGMNNVHR